jgi:uncharacterized damage-inducible protein DinB
MRIRVELARHLLDYAYRAAADNLAGLTLDEALFVAPGGFRSVLGTLKHTAGWSHVYHSFAFDPVPRRWSEIGWPRGLRETVEPTRSYLNDVIAWFAQSHELWLRSLGTVEEEQLDQPRPLHWGQSAPLYDIVVLVASHHLYHAGEINQLLAIARGEAWEEGEEVEENHIATVGHRVTPAWRRQEPCS